MPPADASAHEPERRVTRIAAYALCVQGGRVLLCRIADGYGSTDQARWFTRDQAAALPLVELAEEALRLGLAAES
jgi:hypothetical protein